MQTAQTNVNFQRSDKGTKLVSSAMSKMLIYWNEEGIRHGNGNESFTMYSRDNLGSRRSSTPDVGINRLKKYAYANKNRIQRAIIYSMGTGQELLRFENGTWFTK